MRAEFGAQVTVSLLAHITVFFAANKFLNTTDIPNIKISLNSSKVTETSIEIKWGLLINDHTKLSSIKLTIYPSASKDLLAQTSPVFNFNVSNGTYLFQNLQPHTAYNSCLTIQTDKDLVLTKCLSTQTSYSGFSRLRLFTSNSFTDSKNLDLTLFLTLLFFGLFVVILISSYNMCIQLKEAKSTEDVRVFHGAADNLQNNGCSDELMRPLLHGTALT